MVWLWKEGRKEGSIERDGKTHCDPRKHTLEEGIVPGQQRQYLLVPGDINQYRQRMVRYRLFAPPGPHKRIVSIFFPMH